MFLVMGITGKVGGATAKHLLAHGKEVRALVRNREKAANWANQGVELVDGDWNDSAAIEQALKGVEGAFVDGCEKNQRARDDHGLVASGARFSRPDIPNRVCAGGRIFRKFSLRLA